MKNKNNKNNTIWYTNYFLLWRFFLNVVILFFADFVFFVCLCFIAPISAWVEMATLPPMRPQHRWNQSTHQSLSWLYLKDHTSSYDHIGALWLKDEWHSLNSTPRERTLGVCQSSYQSTLRARTYFVRCILERANYR